MKKILFLLCTVATCLGSCEKTINAPENELKPILKEIENGILNYNLDFDLYSTTEIHFQRNIELWKLPTAASQLKSASTDTPNELSLSDLETMVYSSYFKSLEKSDIPLHVITNYYIDMLQCSDFNNNDLERCYLSLYNMRDFHIYYNLSNKDDVARLKSSAWNCHPSRDCMSCCMYHESNQIFKHGNFVKKAYFMAGLPATAVEMAAGCGWDCAFNREKYPWDLNDNTDGSEECKDLTY